MKYANPVKDRYSRDLLHRFPVLLHKKRGSRELHVGDQHQPHPLRSISTIDLDRLTTSATHE